MFQFINFDLNYTIILYYFETIFSKRSSSWSLIHYLYYYCTTIYRGCHDHSYYRVVIIE